MKLRSNRVHPLTRRNPGNNVGVFAPNIDYRFQPEGGQRLVDPPARLRFVKIEQARMQHQILPHRQFGVEGESLGHEADAPA